MQTHNSKLYYTSTTHFTVIILKNSLYNQLTLLQYLQNKMFLKLTSNAGHSHLGVHAWQYTSHIHISHHTSLSSYFNAPKWEGCSPCKEWQCFSNNNVLLENCALLRYYSVSSGNFLPTFWEDLLVPSSGFKCWTLRMEPKT